MRQGCNRLSLHLVALRHRPIEDPRGVEDLIAHGPPVEMPERYALRRERILRDLRTACRRRADERTLADVRIAGNDDRRDGRIDLRNAPERATGLDERLEVRRDLLHERREPTVRLPAEIRNSRARRLADPTAVLSGDLARFVAGPAGGREMLLQLAAVHEHIDELAIEGGQSVQAREAGDVSAQRPRD